MKNLWARYLPRFDGTSPNLAWYCSMARICWHPGGGIPSNALRRMLSPKFSAFHYNYNQMSVLLQNGINKVSIHKILMHLLDCTYQLIIYQMVLTWQACFRMSDFSVLLAIFHFGRRQANGISNEAYRPVDFKFWPIGIMVADGHGLLSSFICSSNRNLLLQDGWPH